MYTFDQRRLDKLAALREMGVNPYPNGFTIEHTLLQAREHIGDLDREALAADPAEFVVAGRVRFHRKMGKLGFASIQDATGELQILAQRNVMSPDQYTLFKKLDLGDWVWVRGICSRTRKGEPTLLVQELALYAKCIASMPDKMKGFQDPEQRQRMRYLDLVMNESTREVFRIRSGLIRQMRQFFDDRGFMEVETPMLQVIPGGAAARPFVTHHNALGIDLYMRVAPELFLKRLVVGGFERVYEINKNFRNEGISVKHNPEFTMLEFYWAHATFLDLMELTEELVTGLAESLLGSTDLPWGEETLNFARPWRRARMDDLIAEAAGVADPWDVDEMRARWLQDHPGDAVEDLPTTPGKWFERFFDAYVESDLRNPTFVTHYPAEISPLSRRNEAEPRVTDRFELFTAGWEIANGFSELNDPVDQAERFAAQVAAKEAGDDEAMFFDADYVRALSYGMPPTAGEGIGIDRLVMLLTDRHSIREVILFPTMRPENG